MTAYDLLPTLPEGNVWDVREFAGNEVQYYAPGERVELRVLRQYNILGFKFRLRDDTYPVYLVDPRKGTRYMQETAALIIQRHETYLANRAATQQMVDPLTGITHER